MICLLMVEGTYMLDVDDILVPDGEGEDDGEDGAADEGHVPGDDGGQRRHEDVHVVGGGLVGAGQPHQQLVLQLVEVSEKITYISLAISSK